MAIFRQPSAICYNLILVAFDWLFSAVNFDLFPLITCIVTLVAYVWMFTTVCFQMSSLSYRSVGGGACFWTGGCQDHLVSFHLMAILTGQGHISKVIVFSQTSKGNFSTAGRAFQTCSFLMFTAQKLDSN